MSITRPASSLRAATCLLAWAALAACAPDTATPPAGAVEHELLVAPTVLWPGGTIEVCWNLETTQTDATRRAIVRQAVADTWETVANVRFTGWANCPRTGTFGDRVSVHARTGRARASIGKNGSNNWIGIDLDDPNLRAVAVHEFGHALGFYHEQARADTPQQCTDNDGDLRANPTGSVAVGLWDQASIMNYCNPHWTLGLLSLTDIMGVQRYYGARVEHPRNGNEVADLDGDGRADAVALVGDRITAAFSRWYFRYRTPYSQLEVVDYFAAPAQLTGYTATADYGTHYADVDGDGQAEAILVDLSGTHVLEPTQAADGSTRLVWNGTWGVPFYGSRGNAYADVTGDGKADAVAFNDDGIYLMRSSGFNFEYLGAVSPAPLFGRRGTHLADVTGDGKADAIAVEDDGLYVMPSYGTSFGPRARWIGPFYGTRGTAFADVDGDGKADAIAVNDDGLYVAASTGGDFLYLGRRSVAFYGTHGTRFADVDGDGKADGVAFNGDSLWVTRGGSSWTFASPKAWRSEGMVSSLPATSPADSCYGACANACSSALYPDVICYMDCRATCYQY